MPEPATDSYAELILKNNKLTISAGKLKDYGLESESTEFATSARAFVAFCQKRLDLTGDGIEVLSPVESQWLDNLQKKIDRLKDLKEPVGALKMGFFRCSRLCRILFVSLIVIKTDYKDYKISEKEKGVSRTFGTPLIKN